VFLDERNEGVYNVPVMQMESGIKEIIAEYRWGNLLKRDH
jgi:hypothetical protein